MSLNTTTVLKPTCRDHYFECPWVCERVQSAAVALLGEPLIGEALVRRD